MTTIRLFGLITLCWLLTGCFARGGVIGDVERVYEHDVAGVHAAALAVLASEGVSVDEASVDAASSLIRADYADGARVTIHSERLAERTTTVTIQVGTFGDEARSQHLADAMRQALASN